MPGVTPKEAAGLISNPQLHRLKDLGMGFKMGKVLGRRVLVQPVTPFTEMDRVEKEGLLYMPEKAKEQNTPAPTTGIVLQLGEELLDEYKVDYDDVPAWPIKPGDGVLFGKYSGIEATVGNVTYRILNADDILCTIVDAENPEAYAVTTD